MVERKTPDKDKLKWINKKGRKGVKDKHLYRSAV